MRFLRPFFAVALGCFAVIAILSIAVDPFDVFGTPHWRGFNDNKSPGNERYYKPIQIVARQPHTVFMGSSRVLVGLASESAPALDAYNFGISAVSIAEEAAFARHAMAVAPIHTMLLGLDYVSFSDRRKPEAVSRIDQLGPHLVLRSLPQLLISEQAFTRSRGTVYQSYRHKENVHRDDGRVVFPAQARFEPARTRALHAESARYLQLNGQLKDFSRSAAEIDALLADATARRVRVIAFVPPSHAVLMHTLWVDGVEDTYQRWLRALTAICAARGVPLWDFAGFNRITAVPLADSFAAFYDGSHSRPWVGETMLATMIDGRAAADFGVRLTPDNIDAHLAELSARHEAWRAALPADWDDLAAALGPGGQPLPPEGPQ